MGKDDLSSEICATQLKALADKERLRIIQALRVGPLSVTDIAELLMLDIANASHHLGVLRRNGMVQTERQGKNIYYELAPGILETVRGQRQYINLGCCRLEIPKSE